MVVKGRHASVWLVGPLAVKFFKKGMEKNARKEFQALRVLERFKIAPRPYLLFGRVLVMSRVRGRRIRDMTAGEVRRYAPEFLKALHTLDRLGIMKEESHRPGKHFYRTRGGVCLIDFERSHPGRGNVTQFLQFLNRFYPGITRLGKKYKESLDLRPILEFIGSS